MRRAQRGHGECSPRRHRDNADIVGIWEPVFEPRSHPDVKSRARASRAGGNVERRPDDADPERLSHKGSSGELQPGQKLPREPDLAASLGLSRSSLREAVRALSLVRILDVRQGDGTYVSDLSAESLVDTLSFIVEFQHDSSILELLDVRRILEPAACARAAEKMTSAELVELQQILEAVTTESPVAELVQADVEFHRAITAASGNSVLASLIESLSSSTQRARVWRGITQEGALRAPWTSTAPYSRPSVPTMANSPKCGPPSTSPA